MKRGPAQPVQDPLAAQRARLKGFKEEALERARVAANAEGRMPTLTDYFIECELLGQERRELIAAEKMHWNVRVYADMSGLLIEGYLLRKEDIKPPAEIRARANAKATEIAAYQNRKATTLDFLQAMRTELDAVLPARKAS